MTQPATPLPIICSLLPTALYPCINTQIFLILCRFFYIAPIHNPNRMKKLFSAVFILIGFSLFAQKGSVKGFVYDKETAEGIPFATVQVMGSQYGATADDKGFFNIPNLAVGTYELKASYLGYRTDSMEVEIRKDQTKSIKFYLVNKSVELKDVEISASKTNSTTQTRVSVTSISATDMKRLPGVGGEADIAQYLTVLPGVVSTGDQGGEVVIRGGTPIQTEYLLDGIPIYNAFHSIGLFSIYETDVVKNIDVYAGGFPAEYGGRTAAVVDVSMRDGNKKDFSGLISVSPFMTHAVLEIPIIKLKENSNTNASLILATKISYLDQTSKVLYSYTGGLPYSFYDVYGKFTLNAGEGLKFSATGFNFRDNADFSAAQYSWNTYGFGGNLLAIPRNSNMYFNTHVSYSTYAISLNEPDQTQLQRSSSIGGLDIGMDFNYYIHNGELKYGMDVQANATNFAFTNSFDQSIVQNQSTTDLSAYFSYHKYVKKFVIEAGGRFEYYGKVQGVSPEPRVSVKYNITDFLRIKFASGLYSQDFIGTTSSQDVVALFTGFLTGPNEAAVDGNGKVYDNIRNFQRGTDAIFGIEGDLPGHVTINVEPYYKYFWHEFTLNYYKEFNTQPDFLVEKGDAYGVDFQAKWQGKNLYLYATYSLAWTFTNDEAQVYPASFDRRNNVNLLATYTFGKKRDWEASARWNFGTGFPFTQIQAFYEKNPFTNGISTNYTTTNGQLGEIYSSQINGGRLPDYSRLDLSIKKIFAFKKRMKLELNATLTNVYDRQNIFYFDVVNYERVNQLPIVPSIGASFNF